MQQAHQDVGDLEPWPASDEFARAIDSSNKRWSKIADALLAQLRARDYRNADLAAALHDFYLYSMAMLDCTPATFPNTALVQTLAKFLPLLPREFRQTITVQDLTPMELERVGKRIERRFDLAPSPARPKVRRMVV